MASWLEALLRASLMSSALRLGTPLIFASVGGVFSERAGVTNLALEGTMLAGAFAAAAGSYWTGDPWLGLLAASLAGAAVAAVLALSVLTLRAHAVVAGIAIDLFALGLTGFLLQRLFGDGAQPPAVAKLAAWSIPEMREVPVLGPVLGGQAPTVYLALLLVPVAHWVLFRTPLGLRIRVAGSQPRVAEAAGISPARWRYAALLLSGVWGGLGGATLSLGVLGSFTENMTAGRGFIALAAAMLGRRTPLGALGASLLFGYADALQILAQTLGVAEGAREFLLAFPYALTILALVVVTRRQARTPGAGAPGAGAGSPAA